MDILRSLGNLVGSLFSALGVIVLAMSAFLLLALKLELVSIGFFILGAAFFVLVMSLWLAYCGNEQEAKMFATGAVITVALIILQHRAPGLFHLGQAAAQSADLASDRTAAEMETPQATPCQAPYFIGQKGAPRYWYSPGEQPVVCYDRDGFHPVTRVDLEPVMQATVRRIVLQQQQQVDADRAKAEAARAAQAAVPQPTPAATPVPPPPVATVSPETRAPVAATPSPEPEPERITRTRPRIRLDIRNRIWRVSPRPPERH